MDAYFQERPFHAYRVGNPALPVQGKTLGNDVQDLAVRGERHGLRAFYNTGDIVGCYLLVGARYIVAALIVESLYVRAAHPEIDLAHYLVGLAFSGVHYVVDGPGGLLDIYDHAVLQALAGDGSAGQHADLVMLFVALGDDAGYAA